MRRWEGEHSRQRDTQKQGCWGGSMLGLRESVKR